MYKTPKQFAVICTIILLFVLSACRFEGAQTEESQQISGTYKNEEAVWTTRDLLIDNLHYVETENIEGYLSTIPAEAHGDTREMMEAFFETHTLSHTLLAFEVLEELEDEIVVKTKQKTIGEDETGETEYRNHMAEVLIVFEKVNGEWKIVESSITDVDFIE